VPQSWPDRQDEKLREAFRNELAALSAQEEVDIWFADESGFEGDPRPRRRWTKRDIRPEARRTEIMSA